MSDIQNVNIDIATPTGLSAGTCCLGDLQLGGMRVLLGVLLWVLLWVFLWVLVCPLGGYCALNGSQHVCWFSLGWPLASVIETLLQGY